ncbi:MAG: glycosyl hydrolase [Cytophagaceae bacterium]|jgi:hypothetical protein|nr:glycosyl hydrolase [Cytophagaceae bacterium]
MKIWFLLFLPILTIAQVSPKRGLAYGYHSVADLTTVHSGCSWWYNWTNVPDAAVATTFPSIGIEYVPMVWNDNFNVNTLIANIPAGAKYLLAFNEPNFLVEANMTPAEAVASWSKVEQVANARNLEIVSAAPAYGSTSTCLPGYTSPITWHNEFFALCPTCRVDYIAFHCYETTTGGLFALVNNLKVYNRPLWITEYACWDPAQTATYKNTYITNSVAQFENDPDIYRYSWFTGRRADNPSINILGSTSGTLTTLGSLYMNAAYGPKEVLPGRIEAEDHYRRRGTGLETTTDAGGGQNIGWLDNGDWTEHIIQSPGGVFRFDFRVASLNANGNFSLELDGQVLRSGITFSPTGGYQTWTTVSVSGLTIPAGEHLLRIRYHGGGFNINYFDTAIESTLDLDSFSNDVELVGAEMLSVTSPFAQSTMVQYLGSTERVQYYLLDMLGNIVDQQSGPGNTAVPIGANVAPGCYQLLVDVGRKRLARTILKYE